MDLQPPARVAACVGIAIPTRPARRCVYVPGHGFNLKAWSLLLLVVDAYVSPSHGEQNVLRAPVGFQRHG